MIHFGLPTTFFAKHILHSAMESCFAVALTLPQTVFEIGCGNFFSNLDYCINYAFCSSSLFSQIFTNFPQNIYQSHCLYSAYATALCNNSRNSSLSVHLRCSLGHWRGVTDWAGRALSAVRRSGRRMCRPPCVHSYRAQSDHNTGTITGSDICHEGLDLEMKIAKEQYTVTDRCRHGEMRNYLFITMLIRN